MRLGAPKPSPRDSRALVDPGFGSKPRAFFSDLNESLVHREAAGASNLKRREFGGVERRENQLAMGGETLGIFDRWVEARRKAIGKERP